VRRNNDDNMERGIPPLTNKFTTIDKLDLHLFKKNIKEQILAVVDGIVVDRSPGESSVLTGKEKEYLVKSSIEIINGRITVIFNIAEEEFFELYIILKNPTLPFDILKVVSL
jgi:dihydrodipicolinate synthase/N-acetylneuraminate lyase